MHLVAALLSAIFLAAVVPAAAAEDAAPIPTAWLDQKISVAEAEATHPGITDDRIKDVPDAAKPFGFRNGQWEALKAAMQPGDEIWTFASPAKSWEDLAGRAGVALVRDGKPIKVVVTMMN